MLWDDILDFIVRFFANVETRHKMILAARKRFPDGAHAGDFAGWLSDNMP